MTSDFIVTITKTEHEALQFAAKMLAAFKAEGVDAWEGFERAIARIDAKPPLTLTADTPPE